MIHKGTQQIETPNLILRRVSIDDVDAMFRNWAADREVTKFLSWPPHESVEKTRMLLDIWSKDYEHENFYQWFIVLKEIGEPIGNISVVGLEDDIASAEIGYCIGRFWWGRGIVAEALTAVIKYLFDEVGMNRICACHDPKNPNSGAVMRKCGMTYEGTLRAAYRNNTGICDKTYYSILYSEWKESK